MKEIVFGAGMRGKEYISNCRKGTEIIAVCDNNWNDFHGGLYGYKILPPDVIAALEYDFVVIAIMAEYADGAKAANEMHKQLEALGVAYEKIVLANGSLANNPSLWARLGFLENLSQLFNEQNKAGNVAECGVAIGNYSCEINRCFPSKKLYLFDTFGGGFPDRDIRYEITLENSFPEERMRKANEIRPVISTDLLRLKHRYRHNVIIRQGCVPETFGGLEDEKFCFVNLDMNLYKPTCGALQFFRDKMVDGGIILVHDYYVNTTTNLWGARKAVDEFIGETHFTALPIGDRKSVMILF